MESNLIKLDKDHRKLVYLFGKSFRLNLSVVDAQGALLTISVISTKLQVLENTETVKDGSKAFEVELAWVFRGFSILDEAA